MSFPVVARATALASLVWAGSAYAQVALIESPRPSNAGDLVAGFGHLWTDTRKWAVYEGEEYAIMGQAAGGALTARVRSGDPLPAPLAGTFHSFRYPVIGDNDDVVFFAKVDSTTRDIGYFIHTAGGALVDVDGGLANNARLSAGINAAADVVWTNFKSQDLYLFEFATGVNTLVAQRGDLTVPGGDEWDRFGERPVISNNGTIAFIAEVRPSNDRGIYLYDPVAATFTEVAREGGATPLAGLTYDRFTLDQTIGIDDSGRVVFVASLAGGAPLLDGVFLFDPTTGGTTSIALEGDPVVGGPAGAVLDELSDRYVAIDDLGRVSMFGDVDPGIFSDDRVLLQVVVAGVPQLRVHSPSLFVTDTLSPRMSDSTAPIPASTVMVEGPGSLNGVKLIVPGPALLTLVDMFTVTPLGQDLKFTEPSINRHGDIAFLGIHTELYVDSFAAASSFRVHEPGAASPAGGGLVTQRLVEHVMARRFAAFLVQDNGALPAGGSGTPKAIGMFKVKQPNVIVRVAAAGDPAPAGVGGQMVLGMNTALVGLKGRRVLFGTDIVGGATSDAIIAVKPGQPPKTILGTGVPTPVGPFTSIRADRSALVGRWLVFEGVTGLANDISLSIMKWKKPSSLRTLVKIGDPYPTGLGVVDTIGAFAINKRGEIVYASMSDLGETGIFLRDSAGVTTTIVLNDDPVAMAIDPTATYDFDDEPDLAITRNGDVFFTTHFQDATNPLSDGLFHYDGVGVIDLALSNVTATPGGGTFSGIASFGPMMANANDVVGRFRTQLSGYKEAIMAVPY